MANGPVQPAVPPVTSLYPVAQRTPAAAEDHFRRGIEHWAKVIHENKIEAPQQ